MNEHKDIANRWVGVSCYLDCKLATVAGRLNKFATVARLDGSQTAEFSWPTVDRVMRGTMEFRVNHTSTSICGGAHL